VQLDDLGLPAMADARSTWSGCVVFARGAASPAGSESFTWHTRKCAEVRAQEPKYGLSAAAFSGYNR
jgi:hypothetical protein